MKMTQEEQLKIITDVASKVSKVISEAIQTQQLRVEAENGITSVDYYKTEHGEQLYKNFLINIFEPIVLSSLDTIVSMLVKSRYPKEYVLQEVNYMYDSLPSLEGTLQQAFDKAGIKASDPNSMSKENVDKVMNELTDILKGSVNTMTDEKLPAFNCPAPSTKNGLN
jgi:hypothetical protein